MSVSGKRVAVTGALGRAAKQIVSALNQAGALTVSIDVGAPTNPFFEPNRIMDLTRHGDVVANLEGCEAVVHYGSNPWPDKDFFTGADHYA